MIREYYEAICNGVDVRANLIALRNALKDEKEIRAFAYLLGGDFSVLGSLLVHEDPKVRKNAAILLGKMESEDMLPLLFETYQKEETRFIRADYLKAMEHMDYAPYLGKLQERLQEDGITPTYKLVETQGPPHDRTFVAQVFAGNQGLARGTGRTKKEAESQAAKSTLSRLGEFFGLGMDEQARAEKAAAAKRAKADKAAARAEEKARKKHERELHKSMKQG